MMMKAAWLLGVLLLLSCQAQAGKITSALYDKYALVGSLPTSADFFFKFSYIALLERSEYLSPPGNMNQYAVKSLIHFDDILVSSISGFGASVALGSMQVMGENTTTIIGAVGSNDLFGPVVVFDITNNCNSSGCPPMFQFNTQSAPGCRAGTLVVAGDNFVASSCANNLLGDSPTTGITVCISSSVQHGNCTVMFEVGLDGLVTCKGGQMVITSMDARDEVLVVAYCAICSEVVDNKLTTLYISGFAVHLVSADGVALLSSYVSTRSSSCPQAVATNSEYPDESVLDFYAVDNETSNFTFQGSYEESQLTNFGAFVDCDDNIVVASATELIYNVSGSFRVQGVIPCIGYPVQYNYTFRANAYNGTILVITQEQTLSSWGYDVFASCPAGMDWDAPTGTCKNCPPGQHKSSPEGESSYELCTPCPVDTYSESEKFCDMTPCPRDDICPAGSPKPIKSPQRNYITSSVPSPVETDPLEFENTFYNSCYPYFILFLSSIVLVTFMLNLNIFYYPTGEEEGFFMSEEETVPLILEYQNINNGKTTEFSVEHFNTQAAARRRRHIDQFLGSLCSYFFVCTLGLMLIFVSLFISHGFNSTVVVTLQTVDQSSLSDPTLSNPQLAKYAVLQKLDTTPFSINVSLVGYNGECTDDEVYVSTKGCNTLDETAECDYSMFISPSSLSQTSIFTVGFSRPDFYAQLINFNISTENSNRTDFTGNSCVYGAIPPEEGEIIRGKVSVDLMSVLTYIGDCSSSSTGGAFAAGLVRANVEACYPNSTSFRSLSYLSTELHAVDASLYNNLNVSGFAFEVNLIKGPFYKYVQQSYSVSFGTIFTLTVFAALDVYWLIEATVPWLGYIIFKIQSLVIKIRSS